MSWNKKSYSETQHHSVQTTSFRFEVKVITHQSKQRLRATSASSNLSSSSTISNKYTKSNFLKIEPKKENIEYSNYLRQDTLVKANSNDILNSKNLAPVILPIQTNEKTNLKTFNLTDHLKSNIQFDVTLKPSFCIRNNRLDASLNSSQSV